MLASGGPLQDPLGALLGRLGGLLGHLEAILGPFGTFEKRSTGGDRVFEMGIRLSSI